MTIGLLNTYLTSLDPDSYQHKYEPMALDYFARIMPEAQFRTYKVGYDQFPGSVNECDGWIITGSPSSAYEDNAWIQHLGQWIQECHKQKLKLLGICFGHQAISHFLGGYVKKSPKGWGVGVREFEVLKTAPWITAPPKRLKLLFSHQDQVEKLPPEATLMASDAFCPYQMFYIDSHIFSIQGHPEFTKPYSLSRIESRRERLGEEAFQKGISSLNEPTNELLVGQWIQQFFYQAK